MQGESFFGCVYCMEAFPNEKELEVHQKMTHPGQPYASKPAPIPDHEQGKRATTAISKNMPLSEVNRHCIPQDCWVAINGTVYDLTEFADRHPGGPSVILKWAGKDASKMYNDIHKGVKIDNYLRPEATLGLLGVDEQLMSDEYWHSLRRARIEELRGELERLKAAHGAGKKPLFRSVSASYLLRNKEVDRDLKVQLQRLETQKRAALDVEEFEKAQEIKVQIDNLLMKASIKQPFEKVEGGIPLSEVARHNKPHDCWIAINGSVYDLTDLVLNHAEQRKNVLAWAGRDASKVYDKIPGRFPSKQWMEMYMRPEWLLGEVGLELPVDPKVQEIHRVEAELHRLEGPSDEDIAHARAPLKDAGLPVSASSQSEEARFPKLVEVRGTTELPAFTRAEVAKHNSAGDAYMIIHNKVYDLSKLLGSHPGGDDVLLGLAGQDGTNQFEVFEHSEKSRIRRDKDLLIGELVSAEHTDWGAEAAKAGGGQGGVAADSLAVDIDRYVRFKIADVVLAFAGWYAYRTVTTWRPLSKLMYSRALRHMHFLMAIGIFGALGSATLASFTSGLLKKRLLAFHKQTGFAMFVGLLVRFLARMKSGIPPRFPGHPVVKSIETKSLEAFYVLMFIIPFSGMMNEFFLKYAPGDSDRNSALAKQSINIHTKVGRFFQLVWLPFHMSYTTAYHWANGRGVVKKVSPFI